MTEQSGDVQKPVGPFEDREACVRHFGDDPDVDDPEALCGWMEQNKDLAQEYDPQDGGVLEFVEALKEPQAEKVLTNLSVTFVSGVENPAIDSQWVYAKDAEAQDGADWGVTAPIVLHSSKTVAVDGGGKAPVWSTTGKDETEGEQSEEQKAWAPVLIPNETDKQGDVIPSDEIEAAAHEFLAEYRQIDTDHDLFDGKGAPIESWTLKEAQSFTLPDGSDSREYPAGTWMMGVQFADEAWKRVKEGELTGFSIYGEATQIDVEDFLGGDVSPEEAQEASAATAAALAAKGVTGAENEHMSEQENEGEESPTDPAEKKVPAEGVDLIVGSIESYIASNDADLTTSLDEWLEWAVSAEGDFDVSELVVAGQEFTGGGGDGEDTEEDPDEGGEDSGGPEDNGGEEPPEETQMSENENEGGEEPPTDPEESSDEEPTLKDIHDTVKETRDTVTSLDDRVDDLEAEVFDKNEGGDGDGGEEAATPQEDLDEAVEEKMADILGVEKSELPEDAEERNEVIRKHIHESRDPSNDGASPDEWNDEDFAALTGGN